jgi:hypothetical protein
MIEMIWNFRWRYLEFDIILLMVVIKHLKLDSQYIYCTVTLYMFQFVSYLFTVQLTTGVELFQHINIPFLWLLVDVEVLG